MAAATVKKSRLADAAARLDWLRGNALILRSPEVWERYREAVRVAQLLGFAVTLEGGRHRVTPC